MTLFHMGLICHAMTLGDYLKANKKLGKTFARQTGLSEGMVSMLISGARTPSLATAHLIEKKTGGAVRVDSWLKKGRSK